MGGTTQRLLQQVVEVLVLLPAREYLDVVHKITAVWLKHPHGTFILNILINVADVFRGYLREVALFRNFSAGNCDRCPALEQGSEG